MFAPCATGKVLNEDTIPLLRCRAIAGAANNQLATPEDGDRLRDAGILFAPDFVVNAGGVMHLAGRETLGWDDATTVSRLEAIGDSLWEIFDRADEESVSPATAADRAARERVAAARGE